MAGEPVGSPGTIRSASFVFCPEVVPVLKALLDGKLAIGNTAGPDVVHDVRLVEQHALALGLFRRLFGEQLPALLARAKARIGRHVGRLHMTFGRGAANGSATCRERVCGTCRSRWSRYT